MNVTGPGLPGPTDRRQYEGGDHATPDAVRRDTGRYTRLVDKGWRIYRYTWHDILRAPDRIVADLTRALTGSRSA